MKNPTQQRLMELVRYDPLTGLFTKRSWQGSRGRWTKEIVYGANGSYQYVQFRVDGSMQFAHRMAFLYMTGALPSLFIDHKDGDGRNNKWSNLREATNQQNTQANHRANRRNTSGYRGVYWQEHRQKWLAKIGVDGKEIHLGFFDCPLAASVAYKAKKAEVHFQ